MISMSKAYSIRQLRMEGDSIAEISRKLEVSRDTVYKYLAADDLSPKPPQPRRRQSSLDRYRPLIESWLDEDERSWRKQRHTAHRIWARLRDEAGADVGESTVRNYVRRLKLERGAPSERYLDLDWAPGEAQADFGEADFYVGGVRTRMSFFVLAFPYSNVGIAQVFPGENAECVCQALRNIFEHVAGVPRRIVFDNAAGVGRRVGEAVRATEMFSAFAAHYGFAYSFCNPHAGHEKGSVENKVGYVRANLFVPVPSLSSPAAFNVRLLERSMALSDKPHWAKGESELQLFVEDRFAMSGLPPAPFAAVRYEVRKADKLGKVRVDGPHTCTRPTPRWRAASSCAASAPPPSRSPPATAPSSPSTRAPTEARRPTPPTPPASWRCCARGRARGRTARSEARFPTGCAATWTRSRRPTSKPSCA